MGSEAENLIKIWVQALASLSYCYVIASKIPKGKFRLLSLLPIFYLFIILPSSLSGVLLIGTLTFVFSWIGNFKLLLFAFDQGPLSSDNAKSLLSFIIIGSLPIKIKQNEKYTPKDPIFPLTWPIKVLILFVLINQHDNSGSMNPNFEFLHLVLLLYLFIDAIMSVSNAVSQSILGIELEPASDEPYLSLTLQEFWGRRWNLRATNILRITIFNPVKSFLKECLGNNPLASALGVLASFFVSGLMHELMFYYWLRQTPSWKATFFFTLHGVFVIGEVIFSYLVKKYLTHRWPLPLPVSAPLTVAFMIVTTWWILYPPLMDNGVLRRGVGEGKILVGFFTGIPKLALRVF